jgi:hypothetical protein
MDKENILKSVESLTALELSKFISQGCSCGGEITLEELRDTDDLDASKRQEIKILLKELSAKEENFWNAINPKDRLCYQDYIDKYPKGIYIQQAKKTLKGLEEFSIKQEAERQELLTKIRENPNSFDLTKIRQYIKDGLLTKEILINKGIPEPVIDKVLENNLEIKFNLGKTPESIPEGFTEVYFWGIPGSGKTTALSGILSTANKMGYMEVAQGPGFDYMIQLQNQFNDEISALPAPTPTANTQYLPFTLKKPNETNSRSVSLVELSGEIFKCFLYKNASKPLGEVEEQTFNTLLGYLKSDNPKIHFFFVDYDKENKQDREGYTQANYLSSAAIFFNNPEYNIFGNSTDAVYLVITKSDLMPDDTSKEEQVSQYLNDNNYIGFVNSLRNKCKQHNINDGRLLGTPFSLGKVYFKKISDFNPNTSKNIIDILMRRIRTNKKSILDVFNK